MRKLILLVCVALLGACSLPEINWNPFAEKEPEKAAAHAYEDVNPFLWKAAYDKLAFMGFAKVEPEQGLLETLWSRPENNERLKVQVWISSGRLCSDALHTAVLKQRFENGAWRNTPANPVLSREIEKEILLKARELYKNNFAK